jgi:SM-20-related protein
MIQQLMEQHYAVADDFIPREVMIQLNEILYHRLNNGLMKQAGIGQQKDFQRNMEIRRDLISWIDNDTENETERFLVNHIWDFVNYLNETCYTGLNAIECHYAYYDTGSFYKKHRDQFKSDSGRKYSLVTYLNQTWSDTDGGQLVLYQTLLNRWL